MTLRVAGFSSSGPPHSSLSRDARPATASGRPALGLSCSTLDYLCTYLHARRCNPDSANTDFGDHTVPDNDGRQGSNDESVSANKYTIASKNNKFIAQRIASHVADADGPDGQGDGLIAYNDKQNEIKATTGPVMKRGHWDNNQMNYIDEVDLPNLKCPGDTIRCLKSVDFSTKPSGWGTNPGNSFKTDLED